MTEVTLKLKII